MPHKDDPDGEGLSEISFTEPSEGDEEEGEASFGLLNGLRSLHIKDPAAQRHIGIKISAASIRKFSAPDQIQTHLVPEREDKSTYTISNSSECAPVPRGWSRMFPSRS